MQAIRDLVQRKDLTVMNRANVLSLAFAVSLVAGCAHKGGGSSSSSARQPHSRMAASAGGTGKAVPAAPAPAPVVAPGKLAGAWQLAAPRSGQRPASIAATDGTHVKIDAGAAELSGEYVIQGEFLLILTRDERLRPLAWHINSPDSLTVVRGPESAESGTDFTGVTLLRAAPQAAKASRDADSLSGADFEMGE
jgi:hypothetical protein